MSIVTRTLLHIPYPNHNTKSGAIAVVGIVCEAIIIGYKAFAAFSFASINIARPIKKSMN